jgi:predicted anti-sigma-YlaC factor YlaD
MTGSDVHSRAAERFSDYLEGELAPPEKATLEEHLRGCIQCRTNLEEFRRTIGNLAKLKEKAPNSFLPAIQEQINARSRGRFFGKRWMLFGRIPFEWVSLAMIVAMLLYYIVTLRTAPTTVTPAP